MRKKLRVSFKQLVIENKQYLLNNKDEMKKIERKIENKQLSKPL